MAVSGSHSGKDILILGKQPEAPGLGLGSGPWEYLWGLCGQASVCRMPSRKDSVFANTFSPNPSLCGRHFLSITEGQPDVCTIPPTAWAQVRVCPRPTAS